MTDPQSVTRPTNLIGTPLSAVEAELLGLYEATKRLLRRDDLAPCVQRSLVDSAVALNQAVNDMALEWEYLYDLGA